MTMCVHPSCNVKHLIELLATQYIQTSFDECQTLPVIVEPLTNATSTGVPPYYLIAFEVGGIPTTTMIGNDPQNLSWTAIHKAGRAMSIDLFAAKADCLLPLQVRS